MPGQNLTPAETLLPLIGAPNAPTLIDVCIDEDFALDPRLIPGAFRHPFAGIEGLAPALKSEEVIVICQKGLKLSQGAAALLRAHGVRAAALKGGMVEWARWNLPAIPATALPSNRIATAARPTDDNLAALWLIKRFAVPDAHILFVEADARDAVADRFEATPLSGYRKTLTDLAIATPALNRLSDVMKGNAPETAGLNAALTGLRALYPDDLSYVTAAMPLFDALHRAFLDANDAIATDGAAA